MPSLNDYRGMQNAYSAANPIDEDSGFDYGQSLEYSAGTPQMIDQGRQSQTQHANWLSTMSPQQQAEYQQLQSQDFDKKSQRSKLAFAAAVAGMGGLSALYGGGAGLGAGAGAEAGLAGAGAESFPVYSGSVNFTDLPTFAGGAGTTGAVSSPVYSGSMPEFANLNLETGLPMGGSNGAQFGSPEQRASDYAGGYGSTDGVTPASVNSGGNPILDQLKQVLGMTQQVNTPLGQVSQAGKIGSNLLDLYNTYDSRKRNKGFINNLNSLYTQDSPYAQQLNKSLQRAYAASGRRSDIGGRNVELQAKLAEMNSRLAPTLNQANNQQGMYQNRMLGSMWDLGNRTGFFDKAANGLMGLFGG